MVRPEGASLERLARLLGGVRLRRAKKLRGLEPRESEPIVTRKEAMGFNWSQNEALS
jgi:hypothetical protein